MKQIIKSYSAFTKKLKLNESSGVGAENIVKTLSDIGYVANQKNATVKIDDIGQEGIMVKLNGNASIQYFSNTGNTVNLNNYNHTMFILGDQEYTISEGNEISFTGYFSKYNKETKKYGKLEQIPVLVYLKK